MGIELLYSIASNEYSRSKQMAGPVAAMIILQGKSLLDVSAVDQVRRDALRQKFEALKKKSDLID